MLEILELVPFFQEDRCIDHPICYFSKTLNKRQRNYSTAEKEWLYIWYFEVCVSSSDVHAIIVFSDHNPLTFINKVRCNNQRILWWSLMLQEFHIEIDMFVESIILLLMLHHVLNYFTNIKHVKKDFCEIFFWGERICICMYIAVYFLCCIK